MKLLKMKCIKDPTTGDLLARTMIFLKLESRYEEYIYDDAINSENDNDYADYNRWLKSNIGLSDYDVYFYFRATEPEVPIGHTYTDADGLVWERVK